MKNVILLLFFGSFSLNISAQLQKKCSSEEHIEDVNAINQCDIETKSQVEQKDRLSVAATEQLKKIRFFRKRKKKQWVISGNRISHVNNISVEDTNVIKNEIEIFSLAIINYAENHSELIDFKNVHQIPQFKTCSKENTNDCFYEEMSNHIKKHFRYPTKAIKKDIQGDLLVQFIINKEGLIKEILISGPDGTNLLKEEAKRIVEKLPKFIPAKHNGKTVEVRYELPMNFIL